MSAFAKQLSKPFSSFKKSKSNNNNNATTSNMAVNHIETIAFVGAGGRVGSYLSSALASKFKVTAITRPDSNSVIPEGLHATKQVDYNDSAALVEALKGQDALVVTLNVRAQPNAQQLLIDAAVQAGVKYIIPNEWAFKGAESTVGEESGFGTKTADIRKHIETAAQGKDTHWISVTCGFWYEFSLVSSFVAPSAARYGFDHKNKTVTFFDNNGATKIHTTTWSQLARGLLALLSLPIKPEGSGPSLSQYNDSSVFLASFQVSQKDIFESVLRVRGESASDWTVQHEDVKERFERGKSQAIPENMKRNFPKFMEGSVIRMYSRIFWPDGSGAFADKLNNHELGLGTENLDEATKRALAMLDAGSKKI